MALHRLTRFTDPVRDRPGSIMSAVMGMRNQSGLVRTVVSTSATRHVGIINMMQASTALGEVKNYIQVYSKLSMLTKISKACSKKQGSPMF